MRNESRRLKAIARTLDLLVDRRKKEMADLRARQAEAEDEERAAARAADGVLGLDGVLGELVLARQLRLIGQARRLQEQAGWTRSLLKGEVLRQRAAARRAEKDSASRQELASRREAQDVFVRHAAARLAQDEEA